MIYERPDIQILCTMHPLKDQRISKRLDKPAGMNLRPKESKEFTHSNARRNLNPSAVSKQVALRRCARQAHWVFGGSMGKAINGDVKEGVSQMVQNNCKLQTQPRKRRKELPGIPRRSSQRIFLRSTLPRAPHSACNTPKAGKRNGVDITGWLVSPGVRSMYAEEGTVLLDIKHGCCYSLNGVAAHVWVTIEGSPAGITFDGIVDVLETHLSLTREGLERAARDCLADLQLAALVGKKVAGDEEPYANPILPSSPTGRFREFSQEGGRTAICEQHFVQRFETLESLVDQLFPQGLGRDIDWRAKKLKDSIDSASGEVHGGLRDVCRQLQLSLSIRQARRLFKDSTGISISEYHRKRRLGPAANQLQ